MKLVTYAKLPATSFEVFWLM